eukprot:GHVN01047981.1.p1 GENE.GHVN01047981.1~~GHVN01047981.1.p1  ORF type:complete len:485 (+),score=88.53 GHVN01047981.1:173-1456(+)
MKNMGGRAPERPSPLTPPTSSGGRLVTSLTERLCGVSDCLDTDALWAWAVEGGEDDDEEDVTVAILDTGIDYNHPDLQNKIWVNKAERDGIAGVDDDGNGYIDDIYGWNFVNGNNDPMDDNGHGSHVAGVMGAQRDNGVGVAGMASKVKVMPLKILNGNGDGALSNAIPAVFYARDNGAQVITNSWGGIPGEVVAVAGMADSIIEGGSGSVFVVAAGNDGVNISSTGHFPAAVSKPWSLSVASYDTQGTLPSWSNYGATNVHIAAPGENITSTWNAGSYRMMSGTSMSAPIVAGVAAMIMSHNRRLGRHPLQPSQVVDAILGSALVADRGSHTCDSNSLKQATITGGRLNANRALTLSKFTFVTLCGDHSLTLDSFNNRKARITLKIDARGMPTGRYWAFLEAVGTSMKYDSWPSRTVIPILLDVVE